MGDNMKLRWDSIREEEAKTMCAKRALTEAEIERAMVIGKWFFGWNDTTGQCPIKDGYWQKKVFALCEWIATLESPASSKPDEVCANCAGIRIYVEGDGCNDGKVPLKNALVEMTDKWIDNGSYCTQTVIDMRDALRKLTKLEPAAPVMCKCGHEEKYHKDDKRYCMFNDDCPCTKFAPATPEVEAELSEVCAHCGKTKDKHFEKYIGNDRSTIYCTEDVGDTRKFIVTETKYIDPPIFPESVLKLSRLIDSLREVPDVSSKFRDLCYAIEELPASEQQTKISMMVADLMFTCVTKKEGRYR